MTPLSLKLLGMKENTILILRKDVFDLLFIKIGSALNQLGPRWSCLLSAFQVHTTTHCRFYREQLGPAHHKAGPASKHMRHEG